VAPDCVQLLPPVRPMAAPAPGWGTWRGSEWAVGRARGPKLRHPRGSAGTGRQDPQNWVARARDRDERAQTVAIDLDRGSASLLGLRLTAPQPGPALRGRHPFPKVAHQLLLGCRRPQLAASSADQWGEAASSTKMWSQRVRASSPPLLRPEGRPSPAARAGDFLNQLLLVASPPVTVKSSNGPP
jgi:hypothetical protein